MNKLTSQTETEEIALQEEYRYPRKNTVLKFILYCRRMNEGSSYSIQCIKYVDGARVCQSTAPDVSADGAFAEEMFQRIADGEVEPVVLHDVVYDLLP